MPDFQKLTRHIPTLEAGEFTMPADHVDYSQAVTAFIGDLHAICKALPECGDFKAVLAANGIEWDLDSMLDADVSKADAKCVVALLLGAVRSERFCEGALLNFLESGTIAKWLKRLAELDA